MQHKKVFHFSMFANIAIGAPIAGVIQSIVAGHDNLLLLSFTVGDNKVIDCHNVDGYPINKLPKDLGIIVQRDEILRLTGPANGVPTFPIVISMQLYNDTMPYIQKGYP